MNSRYIGWITIIAIALLVSPQSIYAKQPQNDPQTGVTIQLPVLGVSVDAAGILNVQAFPDINGRLMATRKLAVRQNLNADVQRQSPLRKISLRRLEQALKSKIQNGDKIDDELKYLAGLQRAEYVFLMPDKNDVVIAGPAEAWVENPSGRVVGVIRITDIVTGRFAGCHADLS